MNHYTLNVAEGSYSTADKQTNLPGLSAVVDNNFHIVSNVPFTEFNAPLLQNPAIKN